MRSTASYDGHPIHPALIPFPFASLTLALLFDIAGWVLERASLTVTARYLGMAGIAFGLVAAVPGIIDYLKTVPPESSAKARARTHGLLNVGALVLYGSALFVKGGAAAPVPLAIAIEAVGCVALIYAGWLGGVLVNRNLIGVDHRYANAGKWKEETLVPSRERLVAGREDELKPGQMKLLRIGERRVVLGRTDAGYVAFDDRCTHRGGSLAGGVLIGDTVQCLWHGSQFDTTTGKVRCGPAKEGIRCYKVQVKQDDVVVDVQG